MKSRLASIATLVLTTGLNACASAPANVADQARSDRIVRVSDATLITRSDKLAHEDVSFTAKPSAVLAGLGLAYADLGVEVKYFNPGAGEIGNVEFVRMRNMAGEPLTSFLNCGMSVTGQAADTYRITMLLVSTVLAEGLGSKVETRFQARAINPSGSSTGAIHCQSLGTLEQKLHDALRKKLPQ